MRVLHRAIVVIACALAAGSAAAQDVTGRVAVEAVGSASLTSATTTPLVVFDLTSTVRLGDGWDAIVRPWARRVPGGDWNWQMYQMQLRYTSATAIPFRVDAGVLSSPLGLATLELRADRNPTIAAPFYYFAPLPAIDGAFDGARLISGGYPLGAIVSASGTHWDARGGVTDTSPTLSADEFASARPVRAPQLVVGGGVTPVQGFRIGAAFARGRYRPLASPGVAITARTADATVFTLEGEYAVGYTRIAGEWIVDRFDSRRGAAVARGFDLEATRTLAPRWFAAARVVRALSTTLTTPVPARVAASAAEATVGFRVSRQLTIRGGLIASKPFAKQAPWTRAAEASIVWSQRWW